MAHYQTFFCTFTCSTNTQWIGNKKLSQRQCHCSTSGRGPAHSEQLHPHQVAYVYISL